MPHSHLQRRFWNSEACLRGSARAAGEAIEAQDFGMPSCTNMHTFICAKMCVCVYIYIDAGLMCPCIFCLDLCIYVCIYLYIHFYTYVGSNAVIDIDIYLDM